jgi:hypothetical protein
VRMSTDGHPSPHPSPQQQQQQQGVVLPRAPGGSFNSAGPFAATGWGTCGVPSPHAAAAAGNGPGAVRFDSITSPDTAGAAAGAAGQSPQQQPLCWPQQQQQSLAIGAAGPSLGLGLDTSMPHSISTGSMQVLDSPAAAAAAGGGPGGFASGPVSDGVLLAALRRQLQAEGGLSGELPLSLVPTLSLTSQM